MPSLPVDANDFFNSLLMARFNIDGLFYFMAAAAFLLAFLAAGRLLTTAAPPHGKRPFEILTPQAAPLAHDPIGAPDQPASQGSAVVSEEGLSVHHPST
jgi:hypothetical protein